MKITKRQLRRIIKEEVAATEVYYRPGPSWKEQQLADSGKLAPYEVFASKEVAHEINIENGGRG